MDGGYLYNLIRKSSPLSLAEQASRRPRVVTRNVPYFCRSQLLETFTVCLQLLWSPYNITSNTWGCVRFMWKLGLQIKFSQPYEGRDINKISEKSC